MSAKAGSFPWSNISETTRLGRQRTTLRNGDYEWDFTEGWHPKRARGWKSRGKKSGQVKKVKLKLADGREVQVYETSGYDDTVGFHAHDNMGEDTAAYIDAAFDTSNPSAGEVTFQNGQGHIKFLEYSPKFKVLLVHFATNDAECVYMGVPTAVAGTLIKLAKDKTTQISTVDGRQRHLLGIRFWDIVRIRGQQHGSRYPFEYKKRGAYKLTGSKKRYTVTLSDENMKNILGVRYFTSGAKPGDKVTAILTEEEYSKYLDKLNESYLTKIKAGSGARFDEDDTSTTTDERILANSSVSMNFYDGEQATDSRKSLKDVLSDEDYKYYNQLRDEYAAGRALAESKHAEERAAEAKEFEQHKFYAYTEQNVKDAINRYNDWAENVAQGKSDRYDEIRRKINKQRAADPAYDKDMLLKQRRNFARGGHTLEELQAMGDPTTPLARMIEKDIVIHHVDGPAARQYFDGRALRWGQFKLKPDNKYKVGPKEIFSDNQKKLADYLRFEKLQRTLDRPAAYARPYVGMGWTKEKLEALANPSVPGNISLAHADKYKKYLQARDYEGALNFLKNHKHDLVYTNGKRTVTLNKAYAEPHDYLMGSQEE